ncbi:MAG: endospore germination permease [Clostridiales bacterium]|jgi:spore germination protein|nr:endospore germination permease [Clostridiales bacterium]
MLSLNDKITARQLQILALLDIFGANIIYLPREASKFAGQNGWAALGLASCAAIVYVWLATTLGRKFPNESFTSYCGKITTTYAAKILTILFALKIIINVSSRIRLFAEILKSALLVNTPINVIFFGILAVAAFGAAKGYETRARVGEILFPLIFAPLAFIFIFAAFEMDYSNLLPVLRSTEGLASGGFFLSEAFVGVEFALLVHPYLTKPKRAKKALITVTAVTGALMIAVTVVTTAKFGAYGVKREMWPVLEMMNSINLPASFIERQDALVASFWIISVFANVNACLFFSATLMKDAVKKGKAGMYVIGAAALAFIAAGAAANIDKVYEIKSFVFKTFDIAFLFFIPAALLIIAKTRKLGEKS